MKLTQYAELNKSVKLSFDKIVIEATEKTGEKIAVLFLTKPIDMVEGSRSITDEGSGASERMKAYDVETVRVHSEDWEAANIDVDEATGKGTCECDLRLDVSNKMDVWLKSTSFAGWTAGKARERKSERVGSIFAKMKQRETKAVFKADTVGAAEPVAQN